MTCMQGKVSMTFNVVTCVFGIAVLVPAFVVFLQFAILGNVAKSETDSAGTPLATWLSLGTLFGGIAYLIALGMFAWRPQANCRWCLYCLIGYSIYVAGMIGDIVLDDFAHQMKTYGLVSALSNHVPDLLYVAVPLLFVALLIFRPRVEQVSGA